MKPSLKLLLTVTAALGSALAVAQDDRQAPSPDAVAAPPAADAPAPPAATPPPPSDQQPLGGRHGRHPNWDTGFIDDPKQNERHPGDGPQRPRATERSERGPGGEHREHSQHPGDDRHDGRAEAPHGPDGATHGDGPTQRPPMPPAKPAPFLGVVTVPVPPILAAQLGLQEDFGLAVEGVMPNSPAATAGLQRFDVLKLYNDQQIVDVHQLAILVRATGKDGSASLTIIRKAQEEKISIKVGEHVMPKFLGRNETGDRKPETGKNSEHGPGPHGFNHPGSEHSRFADQNPEYHHAEQPGANREDGDRHEFRRPGFDHQRFAHEHSERHHSEGPDAARRDGDRDKHERHGFDHQRFAREGSKHRGHDQERSSHEGFDHERSGHEQQPSDRAGRKPENRGPGSENRNRDFQKRPEGWHHRPSAEIDHPSELPPVDPANLLREIRPGGAAEIRVTQPDGAAVYDTANARVQFSDGSVKIEIATKDGHRTLRATDLEGATLFEGAIETAEQVKSVPEDIRKKADWIESRSQTEVVTAPTQQAQAESEIAESNPDGASVL